jgi:hypothetical protein
MSTTWEEASKCPRDGAYTGRVVNRKRVPEGQLVTLVCPEDNCMYHEMGWVVTIRPDNTIPDKIDPRTRERQFPTMFMSNTRRDEVLAALERQNRTETTPGGEVRGR